jgi:hypothetical protein
MACCPAHKDKSPSLAIKFTNDKPIFYCFAGCSFEEIIGAAGLTRDDLMGDRIEKYHANHPRIDPYRLLDSLAMDAFRLGLIAARIANGNEVQPDELAKCVEIASSFQTAVSQIKNRRGKEIPWTA